jgi:alkylhydroperoxidase/carboxymuconolactone decarboxylase family protein YurZ
LMEHMRQLHPDLADWIILEGYGKVLSRPFLSPRVRELLIVAMTAVLQVERQFQSHVRGSIHAGSTPDELRSVLSQLTDLMEPVQWQNFYALIEACLS